MSPLLIYGSAMELSVQIYDDLRSMQAAVEAINASDSEAERIEGLCKIAFRPSVGEMPHVDPFSSRYRDMIIEIYKVHYRTRGV
jgi:hypothetical protein